MRLRPVVVLALAASACADRSLDPREPSVTESRAASARPERGDAVGDFAVDAVYTGEGGTVAGTRWVHAGHGMPVTVLRIQSVPQVFLAFHTPPVSDRGEPHTGEHLLLGKGTKGKSLSLEQDMSLVESTAWTSQTDVCYSWSCSAGKETFFRSVEQYLDAMLVPDYSDEEIRREVCHVGPVKDDATGKLSVDEKGTIYQEMTTTFEKRWNVFMEMQKRLWGENHALSYSAGGEPSAVRTCEPSHVHAFHAAHYHLAADTQMIVALPDSVPEREFLETLSKQMAAVDAVPSVKARGKPAHPIAPGRPQADRSLKIHPYPNANEGDNGAALLAWTPVPLASQYDRVLGDLFLATLAQGESATLYKRLMDTATREVDVDAAEMSAWLDASKIDLTAQMYFDGLPPRNATKEKIGAIVKVVRDEVVRVAALAPKSEGLAAFNEKALVKLAEREKGLKRQLDAPPLFGHRGAGGFWIDHLRLLDQGGGFERSVTLAPVFAKIRAEIAAGANPWADVIAKLGLSGEPYQGVSVASKAELERRTADHAKRVEGYVADIARKAGTDAQTALAAFQADYDAKTRALDEIEKNLPKPHLVADVPLTADPSIKLEPMEVAGAKGFRGVFDTMTFAETSVSFPLDGVSDEDLPWLAILPQMLTDAGVVIDGKPVPYDKASEMRAKEIYALSASYAVRPSKGRHELRITASGSNLAEAKRAIEWIELCLNHAWLDEANLPRLRDIVAQEIQATRGRLGGADENWVRDPAGGVRWQRDPLFLATSSIHARLFLLARCEWRLMDTLARGDEGVTVFGQLDAIRDSAGRDIASTTANLEALIAKWKGASYSPWAKWLVPIGQRVKEMVGDMAPSTIAADLDALVRVCKSDLLGVPSGREDGLRRLVKRLCDGPARFVMTGSRANTDALAPDLASLYASLAHDAGGSKRSPTLAKNPVVDVRLRDHEGAAKPLYYGLVHNAGTSGVFIYSADSGTFDDVSDAALSRELAARVFGGQGAQGFFMKTWGAGLAYSNGLSVNPQEGRISYYAERCPDLVQTMTFVSGLVKDAGALADPYLMEYVAANATTYTRSSDEFENRTRAAADDMVDGDTPERSARFRKAVLALKDRPGAWDAMRGEIAGAVGRVIPGVGPKLGDVPGGFYFTIAPEPMLAKWEAWLGDHDAKGARVARVYGRDFWMVP